MLDTPEPQRAARPPKRPKADHAGATTELALAGCEPVEQYPGRTSIPFLVRCLIETCPGRRPFRTYLSQVRALRGDSACQHCRARRRANERRAEMISCGRILPLEVIHDVKQPVRGWCMRCWNVVDKPRLDNIRSGQGGCEHCGGKKRFTEQEARRIARAWGYKPLPDIAYENDATKWPGLCLAQGHFCTPNLNMRFQSGPCASCADYGFKPNRPALLYLVISSRLEAAKIGICEDSPKNQRLYEHGRTGWTLRKIMQFPLGRDAHELEQVIVRSWRERGWTTVTDGGLAYNGYTETVSLHVITETDIWAEVTTAASALRTGASTAPPIPLDRIDGDR
ncbi:hypothetical protein AB0I77_15740 [Streptomyces sp. NPDC050619]|uniref:hypothetical protein n=1 Tax=Streptomyces sp. NPDC050619 TaxID=3157214 RepID=UPI00343F7243